jgi:hypothetical protein
MVDESNEIQVSSDSKGYINLHDVASCSIAGDSEMVEEGSSQEYEKIYK